MPLPKEYSSTESAIASYNFTDMLTNMGYVILYGGSTVDLKQLSVYTYYSEPIYTDGSTTTNQSFQKVLDLDFDITIQKPMTFKGVGIVSIGHKARSEGPNVSRSYIIAKLRKWNGTTETEIAENTGTERIGSSTPNYFIDSLDLTIPSTTFKIGEVLRITIEGYARSIDGANWGSLAVSHDPKGRTTGWDATGAVPSIFIFQIPIRMDL